MFKNKIYQHFFYEYLKLFLIVLFALTILIWVTQAARLLDLITEFGNSINVYTKFIILQIPKILINVFQLSFYVSTFLFISNFIDNKELNIYWYSGISKLNIVYTKIKITILIIIFYLILSIFLAPISSLKARSILGNSKFTIVNALVKEQNFNSPLKNLTIYIDENDGRGNLKKVFIYDKNNTTLSKKGKVILLNNKIFLELEDGLTIDENNKKIKFSKTRINISDYENKNIYYPKFNERTIFWLLNKLKEKNIDYRQELREEINSRIIKPFSILVLVLLPLFLLKNDEINKSFKNKFFLFIIGIILIILNQLFLNISSKGFLQTIIYGFSIISAFIIILSYLIFFLKNEKQK